MWDYIQLGFPEQYAMQMSKAIVFVSPKFFYCCSQMLEMEKIL